MIWWRKENGGWITLGVTASVVIARQARPNSDQAVTGLQARAGHSGKLARGGSIRQLAAWSTDTG